MSGPSTYNPKSGFEKWIDQRLPLPRLMHDTMQTFPTPRNLNIWYTFGGILTFCLAVQIITGIVLAMHYVANAGLAFDSVESIMRDVNYGWLIRYIHQNGASMFFIVTYVHIFRGLYYGLAELESDMHVHVHLENHILFPRAAQLARAACASS